MMDYRGLYISSSECLKTTIMSDLSTDLALVGEIKLSEANQFTLGEDGSTVLSIKVDGHGISLDTKPNDSDEHKTKPLTSIDEDGDIVLNGDVLDYITLAEAVDKELGKTTD